MLICNSHRSDFILTPWSRVLLENLIFTQLVKKFPATGLYHEPDESISRLVILFL
jgi:hypothetical protein